MNKKAPKGMGSPMKKGTLGRLIKYVAKQYKGSLITVIICIVLSAIAGSASTMFTQALIDDCITPGLLNGLDSVWAELVKVILMMGIVFALGIITSFIYTRIMAVVTQGTLNKLRIEMFSKMQSLPIRFFDTNAHGDIMSTYTNDTDAIRQLIGQSLPTLIQSVFTIVSIFAVLFYYSVWLTLIVIASIFVMFQVVKKIGGGSAKYMQKQQESLAAEEGFVEEMMNGQKVIKVFCHEEEGKNDFLRYNKQLFEDSNKANIYGNILMPILGNIGNILYVVIAIAGAIMAYFQVTNVGIMGVGTLTIGIIVTFLAMARQLSQTIGQISMQVGMIAMGMAGAQRVFELIDREPESDDGYVTLVQAKKNKDGTLTETTERTGLWAWRHYHKAENTTTYTELCGDIILEEVDFGYTEEKTVLHDVSVFARPGEKVAFVGSTGAGKTTITNLINRFYDIEDGKIRFDGININKIRKSDLRRSLGIVLQDVNLFSGTVMENIRYGRLDASDEECIKAAKLANADDFITRLPDGYNTMLTGNGASLSQGQRQLLSIARAAVADPPAMILDEATSSIDTRTEELVQEGMDRLMQGRTVFVIAHRLSTIRNSDVIMVLDHGRIIERGDHSKLLAEHGTYYQLYTGALEMD